MTLRVLSAKNFKGRHFVRGSSVENLPGVFFFFFFFFIIRLRL